MKKLIIKTFLYLFILILIPYSYLLWNAKQGLDTFFSYHSFGGDIEYDWVLIDFNGRIYLFDTRFYSNKGTLIFNADKLQITPTSIFDLLNFRERVVYQEYPTEVKFKITNGYINKPLNAIKMLGYDYSTDFLKKFYPNSCKNQINFDLPSINFNLNGKFNIDRIADVIDVNISFSSRDFGTINPQYKINNFSDARVDGGFVSDLKIDFSDLSWVQQKISSCIFSTKNTKQGLYNDIEVSIQALAKDYSIVLDLATVKSISNFIYSPQNLSLSFDPTTDKKISEIPFIPLDEYEKLSGLSVKINDQQLTQIISGPLVLRIEETTTKLNLVEGLSPKLKQPVSLPIDSSINDYQGSKILIYLKNRTKVEGYLSEANSEHLKIYQLKHKGKSVLPYHFDEIEKILLLRENKLKTNP